MTSFKIYKDNNDLYSVLFKIDNRIAFFGQKQKSKADCYKTIKLIRHLSSFDRAIKIKKTGCGSWLFYLVNLSSNAIIGESQTYINEELLNKNLSLFRSLVYESKIDSELYSL